MNRKKSLYEILEVSPNATSEEIQAAHQRVSQKLRSEETKLNREDFDFKLKIVNLAVATLADPVSRESYDASLAAIIPPVRGASSRNAVAVQSATMLRKAEAMALRADAMALRADALAIRADVPGARIEDSHQSALSRVLSSLKTPLKRIFIAFGTLAATAMVIQVAFLYFAVRKTEHTEGAAAKAEEKIIIQEYYQEHGVRPKSAIEASLLEQENRRRENELRAAERERQRTEEEERRFHESFRRTAEQVSADLRYAEQNAQREEAYKKAQLEQERLLRDQAERDRAVREQEKWQNILTR